MAAHGFFADLRGALERLERGERVGGVGELGLGLVERALDADELGVRVVAGGGPLGAAAVELGGEELLVRLERGDRGREGLELEQVGPAGGGRLKQLSLELGGRRLQLSVERAKGG